MPETIGFIGLGLMGKPMAGHLVAKGFPVVVHSRSPGPVEALVAQGAERASSPAEIAARATRIITMLPDSPDVDPEESAAASHSCREKPPFRGRY
jgi:3-hydroxyisobutyrate dehydrogenase-like beta-hydroxyacid dehydrogenase